MNEKQCKFDNTYCVYLGKTSFSDPIYKDKYNCLITTIYTSLSISEMNIKLPLYDILMVFISYGFSPWLLSYYLKWKLFLVATDLCNSYTDKNVCYIIIYILLDIKVYKLHVHLTL